MKQHLRELDFMRAIAALAVILIHTTAMYVLTGRTAYFINQGARFAVPLFILLSGFVLFYSDTGKEKVAYPAFIAKRFRKIFVPYIIWTLIYMLYDKRHFLSDIINYKSAFVKETLRNLLLGSGYSHLYFIVIIMQLYFLYPLLRGLVARYPIPVLSCSFAVTAYLQTASYFAQMNRPLLPISGMSYNYLVFPTWIFYFAFGMYIAQNIGSWREALAKHIRLSGLLWIASLALLIYEGIRTGTYGSSVKPTIILYCLCSLFFFYPALMRLSQAGYKWTRLLDWISTQSFLIYFSHLLIFRLFNSLLYIIGIDYSWSGTPGMLLGSAATIVLSVAASYAAGYIPFISLLGGVYVKRELPAAGYKDSAA